MWAALRRALLLPHAAWRSLRRGPFLRLRLGLLSLQIAAVLNSIDHECEGEDFELERIDHFFGEIACRIGDDLICHGCFLPLAAPCSFTWEKADDLA